MNSGADLGESNSVHHPNLKIHLRYITDRCVATSVDSREQAEWPPHPGRLYVALAAAHFETEGSDDDKAAEKRSLEWLATLSAPRIYALKGEERTSVTFYVPVNDAPQANKGMLQSAPGMPRSRQARAFPTVIPTRTDDLNDSDPDVSFEWPNAPDLQAHFPVLANLCQCVIRIGHSSSLVIAWAETADCVIGSDCWEPTDSKAEWTCRIAAEGEYSRLKEACRADEIDLFAQLQSEIESTGGKEQAIAKKKFEDCFGQPYRSSLRTPEPTPPSLGVWQGYRRVDRSERIDRSVLNGTYFERELLILAQHDGPVLDVERTLGLTQALRLALIAVHGNAEIPEWLCGHDPDGSPTSTPHAAFLALPFAGHPHADGHLMGLAIALPIGISAEERGRWLGPLLVDQETGEPKETPIELWGPGLPNWSLRLEERPSPPLMLQNETWTSPSTTWATVTPIVLDRFPKSSRVENRVQWRAEVIEIIKLSCTRAGLPEPLEVDVDSTAWHEGVSRAWSKKRSTPSKSGGQVTSPLGDGFPSLPSKTSRPAKPQVHAWLRFDCLVAGPVLIGAGRFQGYGLCKPIKRRAPVIDNDQ